MLSKKFTLTNTLTRAHTYIYTHIHPTMFTLSTFPSGIYFCSCMYVSVYVCIRAFVCVCVSVCVSSSTKGHNSLDPITIMYHICR